MTKQEKHRRLREIREKILRTWPEATELPGSHEMPPMDDAQQIFDSMPNLEPNDFSAYARQVMDAIGDHQRARSRFTSRHSDIDHPRYA